MSYEDDREGHAQREADIGAEIAEQESRPVAEGWSRHIDGVSQGVTIKRTVMRSIQVIFDEPTPIVSSPNAWSKVPGRTGIVTGFCYRDYDEADVDPGLPRGWSLTVYGDLFKKDGTPMANPGYQFDVPAQRVVQEWCEAHPGWWKVPS